MPTPTGPRSSRALDGVVPNLTWSDFVKTFSAPTTTPGMMLGGEDAGSSGPSTTRVTGSLNGVPVYGTANPNGYEYTTENLGDGTRNVFGQGNNGELISANQTINNDSWWDSTGLPLVASLAFGGATSYLGAIQAAAGTAAGSAAALGQGATNVGAGFAGTGLDGASTLAGSSLGSVAPAASATRDIASADYNPYSPSNWTAEAAGNTVTDASAAAQQTSNPNFLDMLTNGWQTAGDAWGEINPLLRTALTTGAGQVLKGGIGGDGASETDAIGDNFTPTPVDTSYINNGIQSPNIVQNPNGSYGDSTNYGNSLSGGGGIGNTLLRLINGESLGGQDYTNLLSGAGSLATGILGYSSAQTASNQQTSALNNANALTAAIYGDTVNRNAPFVAAGTGAVNQLANLNGVGPTGAAGQADAQKNFLVSDPGYQFTLDQGLKGVQNSAAARGGLYSGAAGKALNDYAANAASTQYGTAYNRLSGLATLGQNSANNTGMQGANYAQQAAGLTTAAGVTQSAGTMGSTNAITNALSQFLKLNQNQNGYYNTNGGY